MKYVIPFLFISILSIGQPGSSIPHSIFEKTLEKDSILNDFSTLYFLLNTIHPGQFMHCKKEDFDRCYDSLSKSIQSTISPIDYFSKTSVLVSKIKDGHAWVDPYPIKSQLKNRLVFPLSIYKVGGNYVFNNSGTTIYDDLIGKTVLKINDQPVQGIASKLKSFISLEGNNETGLNNTFQLFFPFYYVLIDTSSTFKIDYIDSNGVIQSSVLNGIAYKDYTKKVRRIVEPIQQEFKENNMAILSLRTFFIDDFEYSKIDYKKYMDDFFKNVKKLNIDKLIIDVRSNPGGSPEVANYLFSYLTDKSYYYFEYVGTKYTKTGDWKRYSTIPQNLNDIDPKKMIYFNDLYCQMETDKKDNWWFEQQKGKKDCYKGSLITLTDGGCFSTTGHFVALLRDNQIGKLCGESTQGSYYSNNAAHLFQLPYSKLLVRIPTTQFKMRMPNFVYTPDGIRPDIEVLKKPEDFKTNTDRQLNVAMEQLLKK
jgi:hypothetical protein